MSSNKTLEALQHARKCMDFYEVLDYALNSDGIKYIKVTKSTNYYGLEAHFVTKDNDEQEIERHQGHQGNEGI